MDLRADNVLLKSFLVSLQITPVHANAHSDRSAPLKSLMDRTHTPAMTEQTVDDSLQPWWMVDRLGKLLTSCVVAAGSHPLPTQVQEV